MKKPYFVMPTESAGSMIFLDRNHLQQFAVQASRRLSGLVSMAHRSKVGQPDDTRVMELAADLAWQVEQASIVLMEGPDDHQDHEWVPDVLWPAAGDSAEPRAVA